MIYAVVQARMGSSRLPSKVMLILCDRPVLWHVVNRVGKSQRIDRTIVATSGSKDNDVIREFCLDNGIECFSGNENDVLDRYYQAMKYAGVKDDDLVVRITADCPLIDPVVIDEVIEHHLRKNADYTSNCIEPTFPDGLDCEVFNASVLRQAWANARLQSEREHVTLYIRNHPELFKVESYKANKDFSNLRWTLDEQEDYQLIEQIYCELYADNGEFGMQDILRLFEATPSLALVNSRYTRNEGLAKSLREDSLLPAESKEGTRSE